ncbi:MAG: nuclease-related domain-containing protein [Methylococcus sp.]|nr:nuclease-related domain-containing protein [Methylococcus sp.]
MPAASGLIALGMAAATGVFLGRWLRIEKELEGEAVVRQILTANLKPPQYHVMNNLTLRSGDGTTQVDHVVVSRFGVFVIESKHYRKCWIFGDAKSPTWTAAYVTGKFSLQNPLLQNYKHVKTLEALLKDILPPEHLHSWVAFTGSAEFKTAMPENVTHAYQLIPKLQSYNRARLSPQQLEQCVGRLECHRLAISKKTDVEHVAYLNRKFGGLYKEER